MNPEQDSIVVERVANGWVVYASSWRSMRGHGDASPESRFVAGTPSELSELLRAWATAQEGKE